MAQIDITEIISADQGNPGSFESIMTAVSTYLEAEFDKGRIKAPDYAKVYLSAMEAALQQSLAFALQKQQADKQAELLDAQRRQVEKEIEKQDVEIAVLNKQSLKVDEEITLLQKQQLQTDAQTTKLDADKDLVLANITKINPEIDLINAQKDKTAQDRLLGVANEQLTLAKVTESVKMLDKIDADISQTTANISLINANAITEGKKADKLVADTALTNQQKDNLAQALLKDIEETNLIIAKTAQANQEAAVLVDQQNKLRAEKDLIAQKKLTEEAQVADTLSTGSPVAGVLSAQKDIYKEQAATFVHNKKYKMAKLAADVFSMQLSANPTSPIPSALSELSQSAMITDAAANADITLPSTP
jgi:hypothetical protein